MREVMSRDATKLAMYEVDRISTLRQGDRVVTFAMRVLCSGRV